MLDKIDAMFAAFLADMAEFDAALVNAPTIGAMFVVLGRFLRRDFRRMLGRGE